MKIKTNEKAVIIPMKEYDEISEKLEELKKLKEDIKNIEVCEIFVEEHLYSVRNNNPTYNYITNYKFCSEKEGIKKMGDIINDMKKEYDILKEKYSKLNNEKHDCEIELHSFKIKTVREFRRWKNKNTNN